MTDFEKFKEELLSKEKFYSLLTNRNISNENNERLSRLALKA